VAVVAEDVADVALANALFLLAKASAAAWVAANACVVESVVASPDPPGPLKIAMFIP
jgi:hypothetical protein